MGQNFSTLKPPNSRNENTAFRTTPAVHMYPNDNRDLCLLSSCSHVKLFQPQSVLSMAISM